MERRKDHNKIEEERSR